MFRYDFGVKMLICIGFLREAIKRTFTVFIEEVDDMSLTSLIGVITRNDNVSFLFKMFIFVGIFG